MLFPKICQVKSTNLSIGLKYMCYMHIRNEAKRVSSFNNYGGILIETNMHDMICVNITLVRHFFAQVPVSLYCSTPRMQLQDMLLFLQI